MTTTPNEPVSDPDIVPSTAPIDPIAPGAEPEPGEDPGAVPEEPETRPSSEPF